MSLRKNTPCDMDGICPYDAQYSRDCEYWCGVDEEPDIPEIAIDVDECGFDPYEGAYTFDC